MLRTSTIEGSNIVTATYAAGSVSGEQMEELRARLTSTVALHGKARLLVEIGEIDLGRIEPRAVWEDLKLIGMMDDLDRYAVVTDQEWVGNLAGAADIVAPFELRVFPADRRDDAVAWLSEQPADPPLAYAAPEPVEQGEW